MSRPSESRIKDIALVEIDRSRNHRIPTPGDAERIESLKASIEACGQLQPVRVYERGEDQKNGRKDAPYILGFGSRRLAAVELLGYETIRAVVFPPASDAEIAQARAVENLHRQDITPLEEVLAVSDMLEAIKADVAFTGDPYEEVASRLARSVTWVRDRDYLHRLTKAVRKFALQSGLPAGHLRELAKVGDAGDQLRLACECAGAPAWCFAAQEEGKDLASHNQDVIDGYFAELADGKANRWPLSKLKLEVAKVQHSLKVIPWEFDRTVQHHGVKLRKCAGCPHNSETDRTLFGIDEDAANPRGYCLNASCYTAKQEATQSAKEEVYKKISGREVQTPEAIRKAAPPWIKESSVVGYVKRQLEKQQEGQSPTESRSSRSERSAVRSLSPHELALEAFREELESWQGKSLAKVLRKVNADPACKVGWCVLLAVDGFLEHPRIEIPYTSIYSSPSTREPVIPDIDPAMENVIARAFAGTKSAWMELLADEKPTLPENRRGYGVPHPQVLAWLAAAVGVKLPPTPQWTPAAIPESLPSNEPVADVAA
ncbi:ParB/RepB/Spo0J family partition protein [Humisphaera borealis]|uniref:ParB N-terminal domain-containing protein n=1 Tax=Humisphaera borealis TaxID=2807512 RepID=A0A7M2X4X4_9BACT|nr:ParB N-terminal domain-containing protein [Humisphaera borealis]QOV92101.1 ParB N-terminal domain-containing protein [Humisphaera borealis]